MIFSCESMQVMYTVNNSLIKAKKDSHTAFITSIEMYTISIMNFIITENIQTRANSFSNTTFYE